MIVKVRIKNRKDKDNVIKALANNGYKTWIRTESEELKLLCFEIDSVERDDIIVPSVE